MSDNLNIEPRVRRLNAYIQDIERGLLQIPPFQRDKVWGNIQRKELFDSFKKGYPIGSILLWKPSKEVVFETTSNEIGPYSINTENNQECFYILDGFQRLSTIFGCLINPDKTSLFIDKNEWKKDFAIYYDLKEEEFFIPRSIQKCTTYQVPVYQLIDTRAAFLLERELHKENVYSEQEIEIYINRYHSLATTLIDYSLSSTEIKGGTIEDAVDIFSRINSRGSIISLDWMVSALTYNQDNQGFKLSDLIDDLVEELKIYNFDTVKRELLLQCIIHSFGKAHFDQGSTKNTRQIETLVKQKNFVEVTKKTIISIKKAVKFLFEDLLVLENKLLPYGNQLVFITDFFNQIENPNEKQLEKLKEWFWITTYANYFSLYPLSKQRKAYHQFQDFLKGRNEDPVFNDKPNTPFEVMEFPSKVTKGSVRANALILFMLNSFNHFKKVDAKLIDRLKLNILFFDIKNDKGGFHSESVVAVMENLEATFSKSKDMSFMLESEEDYNRYFITDEMKDIFLKKEDNFKLKILEIRRKVLIDSENIFIQKLGLCLAA